MSFLALCTARSTLRPGAQCIKGVEVVSGFLNFILIVSE